jgi:heterodisulfide reductase subunit A-like polyferredoxin/coenzyme F420-reducing hydrogenase delta subunit
MEKKTPKIGLYIFDPGERLARAIDLQAVVEKCAKIRQVEICEVVPNPWADQFLPTVKEAIGADRVDRLIWVGRFTAQQKHSLQNSLADAGLNPYLNEWCDLELQGIGPDTGSAKVQVKKAMTLIKMALARVKLLQPLDPLEIPSSNAVVIVGAGISGLHAAASFIERGKHVHLVEQQSGVGGKVALLSRFYPLQCNPQCGIEYVLKTLRDSDQLTIHTLSKPLGIEGAAGNFSVNIQSQPRFVDSNLCNACGQCAEVCPAELPVFTDAIQDEPPFQQTNGIGGLIKETRKAIHPATPYPFPETYMVDRQACPPDCRKCETVCPTQAIHLDQSPTEQTLTAGAVLATTGWDPYPLSKLNNYYGYSKYANVIGNLEMEQLLARMSRGIISVSNPPVNAWDTVGFIQCAGSRNESHLSYCSSVCCSITMKQIKQLKSINPEIKCIVYYQDIRCNGFEEELYRHLQTTNNVLFVRGFPKVTPADTDGNKLTLVAEDTFSGRPITTDLDLLVLAGGMQPSKAGVEFADRSGLPLNQHNFFTGHYQCYPEESQRTGILTGGCARGPMNVSQSIESANRAAMKALNFLEGTITIDPTYPIVNKTKCDQCKRCVEECPYACYRYDEKGFPEPDLTKCRQCGNCMGTCPVGAISLNHLTIKQLAAQVAVLETSFLDYDTPIILAFLCENDAYVAAKSAMDNGLNVPINVIHLKVPCAGAVNNAVVADALSLGVDGVLIAGCQDGQCHYIRGNELVRKRSGDLSDKLGTMRIEPERVRSVCIEIQEAELYVSILEDYIKDLTKMGPNPFKI